MRTVSKMTMTVLGAALLGTTLMPQAAQAGDSEWATAGKILTGVVGLHVLSNIASSDRGYSRYESRYEPRSYTTYRETRYVERDCRPVVRVQQRYEAPRPVYYGDYYSRRSNVSYYEVERPAPAPQVVYVQQPAPQPQVVYVQQPAPAPQPQVVYVQNEQAQAPAPQNTGSTNPTGNDVDESIFVVAKVEDGKRIVQPRVRGADATMQMWSDVRKEWVDIKSYPSIY